MIYDLKDANPCCKHKHQMERLPIAANFNMDISFKNERKLVAIVHLHLGLRHAVDSRLTSFIGFTTSSPSCPAGPFFKANDPVIKSF